MQIEILGDGCSKCREFLDHVRQALAETGIEAEVQSVNEPERLAELGLLTLPGMAIDGDLKVAGKILSVEEIRNLLRS